MYNRLTLFLIIAFVAATPDHDKDLCHPRCTGEAYECVYGTCLCANGYVPGYRHTSCIKCPELGETCFKDCCNSGSNESLQCWHGVCLHCIDPDGKWICRNTVDQIILASATQVIMGTALILGIMATFMLILKLCSATTLRPLGNVSNYDSRLSLGSLQLYVEERLRDAPPRYSNTPPSNTGTVNTAAFNNEGFIHDHLVPPPPLYAEVIKNDNNQNQITTVHI